jgi:hypothetical protein
VDYRFEVVRLPVSDVGKAKDCSQGLPSRARCRRQLNVSGGDSAGLMFVVPTRRPHLRSASAASPGRSVSDEALSLLLMPARVAARDNAGPTRLQVRPRHPRRPTRFTADGAAS